MTLFSGGPLSVDEVLAEGTAISPDVGNGCEWTSLEEVFNAIRSGNAYTNVHTVANPGGEIRGQIR